MGKETTGDVTFELEEAWVGTVNENGTISAEQLGVKPETAAEAEQNIADWSARASRNRCQLDFLLKAKRDGKLNDIAVLDRILSMGVFYLTETGQKGTLTIDQLQASTDIPKLVDFMIDGRFKDLKKSREQVKHNEKILSLLRKAEKDAKMIHELEDNCTKPL